MEPQEQPKRRIMIVEDEAPISSLISDLCAMLGFETLVLSDGSKALEAAKQFHPDLITLDLVMPGVSGAEVLQKLKNDPATKNTPVLIISSIADSTEARDLMVQCQGMMSKPIRVNLLKSKIDHAIPAFAV